MDLQELNWKTILEQYILKEGRPSKIPLIAIRFYVDLIVKARKHLPKPDWLPSVRQFSDLVMSDPILKMNWIYGIKSSEKTIADKTSDEIFDMIDTVCKTPPQYINNILVGVPINAIFIEFMQNQNGRTFFSHERVNQALKNVLNDYGKMLQSPQSTKYLTTEKQVGWFSEEADKEIHMDWYKCDPSLPHYGFKDWNQWFLREFKDGMRPIGQFTPEGVDPNDVIVNSCQSNPLTLPKQPFQNAKFQDQFWLKDDLYSLTDMFGGKRSNKEYIAQHFQGGTIYQAFLSALSYHRWHAPVDGTIEQVYLIDGTYYLDQSQFIQFDEGSPQKCQSFLSAVAARMVILIKADNPKIGKIAIIYIGMSEVSTCVATVKVGEKVKKGQQIGNFMFGGSSHLMVFQKKAAKHMKFKTGIYKKDQNDQLISLRQNVCSYLAHVQDDHHHHHHHHHQHHHKE